MKIRLPYCLVLLLDLGTLEATALCSAHEIHKCQTPTVYDEDLVNQWDVLALVISRSQGQNHMRQISLTKRNKNLPLVKLGDGIHG